MGKLGRAVKKGDEAIEAKAKLMEMIYLEGLNDNRRKQADMIEEYGPADFWSMYKIFLREQYPLRDDLGPRWKHFTQAVEYFHCYKEVGPVSDLESEIEDLEDKIEDLEEKLEAEKPTFPTIEKVKSTMLRMCNEATTAAYRGTMRGEADQLALDLARVHLKEVRTGGRPVNEILIKVT